MQTITKPAKKMSQHVISTIQITQKTGRMKTACNKVPALLD